MTTELSLAEKLYNFEYDGIPLTPDEIRCKFGDAAVIYAMDNEAYFTKQLKHNKFFFGSYSNDIKCISTSMPFITQQIEETAISPIPRDSFAKSAKKYYIDLFAHDPSIFTVKRAHIDKVNQEINNRIIKLFDIVKYPLIQLPTDGNPAFVTHEKFLMRVDKLLRKYNGDLDKKLIDVWNNAGYIDKSNTNQSYETLGTNYCIGGGSISKLLDPYIDDNSLCESDIDIFVFGNDINQRDTIERLIAALFEPGKTYVTIRGSVINIRRIDCVDVQIISSQYINPMLIISTYDAANVMCYWFGGTVHVNAACVEAFRTRVVKYKPKKKLNSLRIIKIIKYGFVLKLALDTVSKTIQYLTYNEGPESFKTKLLINLTRTRITSAMKEYEIHAHILRADIDVPDIITENPSISGQVSDQVLIGNVIDDYTISVILPHHFSKANLKDIDTATPESRIFIYIAGFRARIKCNIVKILNYNSQMMNVIFDETTTRNIMEITETLNAKMINMNKPLLDTSRAILSNTNNKITATVTISNITKVWSIIDKNHAAFAVGFTIYCENANKFRLELTYV